MSRLVCFETVVEEDGCTCRRTYDPPHLTAAPGGAMVLRPPPQAKATVNGIAVVGFQVLRQGDAVRIDPAGGETPTATAWDGPWPRSVRATDEAAVSPGSPLRTRPWSARAGWSTPSPPPGIWAAA